MRAHFSGRRRRRIETLTDKEKNTRERRETRIHMHIPRVYIQMRGRVREEDK